MSEILLVDNGSLRADATKQLRKLAQALSVEVGQIIHPVSLQHADKIPVALLEGREAQIFSSFMQEYLSQGKRHFIILPLFFGESRAIEYFIQDHLQSLQSPFNDLFFQIADVVCPLPEGEPLLVDILYDHIIATAYKHPFSLDNIILVDHGSPLPSVTAVRQHLAKAVQNKLPMQVKVEQAVMERRKGKEYLFNGELLKDCLIKKAKAGERTAIVSLLFFLAGRHAGTGGDIEEICRSVMSDYPDFNIVTCPLISEHKKLVSILFARLQGCIQKFSTTQSP